MSINIQQLTPSNAIHPGYILKDELDFRNITQKDFALLTGIPQTQLNEVIKGKRAFNPHLALVISKALEMDAILWLNLQSNYELDLAKINEKNSIRLSAIGQWQMIKLFIAEKYYKKMGVITGNPVSDIPFIKKVFGIVHLEELPEVYNQPLFAKFKKSNKLNIDKINSVSWVKLIKYQATSIAVRSFNANELPLLIADLRKTFTKNKNTIEETKEVLAKYGIKFLVLTHPEKCAIDGISFWSGENPAIGLTTKLKRLDNFAFTVLHELGHIFLHLTNNKSLEFIDMDKEQDNASYKISKEEIEANEFSKNALIDQEVWNQFKISNPFFNETLIKQFAGKIDIHPAIVQGRYCFEKDFFKIKSTIDKVIY